MTIAKNKGADRTALLQGTTTCHHRDMNLGMELSDEVREGHSTGRARRSRPSGEPAEGEGLAATTSLELGIGLVDQRSNHTGIEEQYRVDRDARESRRP